jgi:hypothetical protein
MRARGAVDDAEYIISGEVRPPPLVRELADRVEELHRALRALAVTYVTANPRVLHHYRCALCGGRWSGPPSTPEQHKDSCLAKPTPLPTSTGMEGPFPTTGWEGYMP